MLTPNWNRSVTAYVASSIGISTSDAPAPRQYPTPMPALPPPCSRVVASSSHTPNCRNWDVETAPEPELVPVPDDACGFFGRPCPFPCATAKCGRPQRTRTSVGISRRRTNRKRYGVVGVVVVVVAVVVGGGVAAFTNATASGRLL